MQRYEAAKADFEATVATARQRMAIEQKRRDADFDDLDGRTIAILASIVVSDNLALDEEVRLKVEPSERKRQRAVATREIAGNDLAECRELRAIGDIEAIIGLWGDEAASQAEMEGLVVDRSSASFATLCSAINDAQIAAWEGLLARLKGDLVPTPPLPEPLLPNKPSTMRSGPRADVRLLDLFERYASVPDRNPKTVAQWRPYIAHLVKFAGKDKVSTITHEDLVAWRNYLRDEQRYKGNPLSAKTINGSYLGAINALLAWARGDNIIDHNPMLEVKPVKGPAKPTTRGNGFTTDEVMTILRALSTAVGFQASVAA